ncbi:uncharacterized protein LOC126784803 [Argentina anserina]|uniref:uncharacterized protein LOC126784803 n=1 Tax=Argentina anserina TaxID=57926 RepID=UPI0021763920|nr:uncharacterized protein LOC126784803 [Potentilla anserina]
MSRLPKQVVHEGFDSKAFLGLTEQQLHHDNRLHYHDQLNPKFYSPKSPYSPHYMSRPNGVNNWVSGGHGMQAVFLDSSSRKSSGGTGVFLPQTADTNFHSKKKPACAPVLLPDRVIQALNLNVHALGLHISPKDSHRKRFRSSHKDDTQDCMPPRDKTSGSKIMDEQCYIISDNHNDSSPELCLPKEWTY